MRRAYPFAQGVGGFQLRAWRFRRIDRRVWIAVALFPIAILLVLLNSASVYRSVVHVVAGDATAVDWNLLVRASALDSPFGLETFRWSPVAAWTIDWMSPMGVGLWRLAHFAALVLLWDWRLILVALMSAPFWADVSGGETLTFVVVAGVWAVRGNAGGTVAWFALAMLAPRPLMLPLTVWLLWQRPHTRLWFAVVFAAHAAVVLASGLADDWAVRLLSSAGEMSNEFNIGPSQWLGWAWLPIGVLLSGLALWRGHIGLASLCIQPYMFVNYLGMLALGRAKPIPVQVDRATVANGPRLR